VIQLEIERKALDKAYDSASFAPETCSNAPNIIRIT
jgi:hypothetical protein